MRGHRPEAGFPRGVASAGDTRAVCRVATLMAGLIAVCLALDVPESLAAGRQKRSKVRQDATQSFDPAADESVSEQINDPTSFLREVGVETSVEHGTGASHTLLEWTPWLGLPLSERFRFEAGFPIVVNGPGDRDDVEPGDLYTSLAYIFAVTEDANYLVDGRVDFPTGNAQAEAGLGVAQWHLAVGSVIYALEADGFLLIPWLEYRRSIFDGAGGLSVSSLLASFRAVYLISDESYFRAEGTLNFAEVHGWDDSGLLNVELGRVFLQRYSVAVGYEFDLWGDPLLRNSANLSLSYLF